MEVEPMTTTVGYRFRPNDREIINDYLLKRMDGHDFGHVVGDIDLFRHEPWELPGMSVLKDDEVWYFFCRPEYKYMNSKKANRTTGSGYWKPTGKVRPIRGEDGAEIGTKRTLVFYFKWSTDGSVLTPWVIHEYQVHNVSPAQTEFVFCKLKYKEDEQITGSILEEAEPEDIVHIQRPQDVSDTEFDPNDLASQDISGQNWSTVNHHLSEDGEDQVDQSFADQFLVDPEESVKHVHLFPDDHKPQGSTEHCYRVDQTRNFEFIEDYAEPEFRGIPYQNISLMGRKRQPQVVFPTTNTANLAEGNTLHSCRNSGKVTDLKKVWLWPPQASASVTNTETSSFIDRKTASSHPTAPGSVYLVNMIVGLILIVVVIIQLLSRVVPSW